MEGDAIVLTGGLLETPFAKTAHGLIRKSGRYRIRAIIDSAAAGRDAGEVLDGKVRHIPVYASIEDFLRENPGEATVCIVGIANAGGRLPQELRNPVKTAISAGMSVVCGLHEYLSEDPEFRQLARQADVELIDIRRGKSPDELQLWQGDILKVDCLKLVVMGTDCGLGKRTTALLLLDALKKAGLKAEFIYTGQTGWLQGGRYGFILDSTPNEYIAGELERAMVRCYEETRPDVIVVEGQAALRNPSGPCGAEFLISGRMDGVVLHHAPMRQYYKGWDALDLKIPPLEREIKLIAAYGVRVMAVTLNTRGLKLEEALSTANGLQAQLGVPVYCPLEEGLDALVPLIRKNILT